MSNYFITMQKVLDIIWETNETLVGVSRGSVTGSLIAFTLGITQLNPIHSSLPFEVSFTRFMTRYRADIVDIDSDISSHNRNYIIQQLKNYMGDSGEVVTVGTYNTIKTKSAIKTACRGLNIDNNVANILCSKIPIDRGVVPTLNVCYYGDSKNDIEPLSEFVSIIDKYDNLYETAKMIEGLKIGASMHASGVIIKNGDIADGTATMKTKSGITITQYSLHDAEKAGMIKIDLLVTDAISKLTIAIKELMSRGLIKVYPTLRETYMNFLHPHKIDLNNKEIWKSINNKLVLDLFQFTTQVGAKAISDIQPHNLMQLMQSNSLMRLKKSKNAKYSPMELFIRYKNNIDDWYKDMLNYGLTNKDIEIIKPVLLPNYGVASEQEVVMQLVGLKELSNFNVGEQHVTRKSVAKKNKKAFEDNMILFKQRALENGASFKLIEYVRDEQIALSIGYAFSQNHTLAYSFIAIQEAYLWTKFPLIWNWAVLQVNTGGMDLDNSKTISIDYGKIAVGINDLIFKGVSIASPHINKVKFGFIPDEVNNEIVYGLKPLVNIGDNDAHNIINNKPYANLNDAYEKLYNTKIEVKIKDDKIQNKRLLSIKGFISLIKSGAFDLIENTSREDIMNSFLTKIEPKRESLNMQSFNQVVEMNIIPEKFEPIVNIIEFRTYVNNKKNYFKPTDVKSKKWHLIADISDGDDYEYIIDFFNQYFETKLEEHKDYYYDMKGNLVLMVKGSSQFEKEYKIYIKEFNEWLNSNDCLSRFNKIKFNEIKERYASGSISKWEMDSMSCYIHEHELTNVDLSSYRVDNLNDVIDINDYTKDELDTFPVNLYKGVDYIQYPKQRIAGTVINKDNTRHTITLLTTDGIMNIKFSKGAYNHYNQSVSKDNGDGTSSVLEKGWFANGIILIVVGYKDDMQFMANKHGSNYLHSVVKCNILNDNKTEMQTDRIRV